MPVHLAIIFHLLASVKYLLRAATLIIWREMTDGSFISITTIIAALAPAPLIPDPRPTSSSYAESISALSFPNNPVTGGPGDDHGAP